MTENRNTAYDISYKVLVFKWLNDAFCSASVFVPADRDEALQSPTFHTRNRYVQASADKQ